MRVVVRSRRGTSQLLKVSGSHAEASGRGRPEGRADGRLAALSVGLLVVLDVGDVED